MKKIVWILERNTVMFKSVHGPDKHGPDVEMKRNQVNPVMITASSSLPSYHHTWTY
jgi:hypothetical protein